MFVLHMGSGSLPDLICKDNYNYGLCHGPISHRWAVRMFPIVHYYDAAKVFLLCLSVQLCNSVGHLHHFKLNYDGSTFPRIPSLYISPVAGAMSVILPKVWDADVNGSQSCSSSSRSPPSAPFLPGQVHVELWDKGQQLLLRVSPIVKAERLEVVRNLQSPGHLCWFQLVLASDPSFLFNCPGCWLQAPVPDTEATTSRRQSQFPIIKPLFYTRPSGSASLDPTLPGTLGGWLQSQRNPKLPSPPNTSLPPASLGGVDGE